MVRQPPTIPSDGISACAIQAHLFAGDTEPMLDDAIAEVMQSLGMTEPLTYERREIPLARVRIPHEERLRGVNRYTRNIRLVGVLHDPAVVPVPDTETFEVVFGRHRISGAHDAGHETLWMRVYAHLSPKVKAFLRLTEQRRRTLSWVDELEQVLDILDDGGGLSEQEIAWSLGVPITTLRFYFKVAKLPDLVRERILVGDVTATTVRRLLRLGSEQLAVVEDAVIRDQPLDDTLVKPLVQQRVSAGMQQIPLLPTGSESPVPCPPATATPALGTARQLLHALEVVLPQLTAAPLGSAARVQMSGRIFAQEMRNWLRAAEAPPEGGAV